MTDQPIPPADEQVLEALAAAYSAGATDTHNWWAAGNVEREADFGEAASDYARSIDLTALAMRPAPDAVLREAIDWFRHNADGLKSDVAIAHRSRGNGCTEWMREDDRDFRRDLDKHLAALASPASTAEGEASIRARTEEKGHG